jgi:hypothetical protein
MLKANRLHHAPGRGDWSAGAQTFGRQYHPCRPHEKISLRLFDDLFLPLSGAQLLMVRRLGPAGVNIGLGFTENVYSQPE